MSKFAVLGSPIAHSKSPAIHQAAFAAQNLNHSYERFELADGLADFLAQRADFTAFSVTMPLKEQALAASWQVDERARRTGAVNTLLRTDGQWLGFNTDVAGLVAAARPHLKDSVAILGSGATARSALVAFQDYSPLLWARDSGKAEALASRFGAVSSDLKHALSADLVISTLTKGALDTLVSENLPGVLLDVTYDPWPNQASGFFKFALSGLELLIQQALLQQRIFLTASPEIPLANEAAVLQAMRDAVSLAE